MANESKIETPEQEFQTSKTEEDKKIDRIAERAAEKAGNTEKHYDQGHDIFTK
jgi:glucan-binding YG repeat protein